jgi:cytochrome c oxidase assembly protein subunit 15
MGVKAPGTTAAWARASLTANVVIVLTGGLVRLTDSGLGCPRWPKCDAERWTTHPALGIHGAIEFGNRLLTYVLVAVAVGTLISVWQSASATRRTRGLAVALAAGIPLQGVLGGLTVLTHLNPWLVSLHLVLSMLLIAGSAVLIDLVTAEPRSRGSAPARMAVAATVVVATAVVYLGTIVTGSGPHAGDAIAPRNGLDAYLFSRIHAGAAYTLVGLTVVSLLLLRGTARRAAWALLAVEAAQATIGIAQYNLGLPIAMVAAHLLGAALLIAAVSTVVVRAWTSRDAQPMNGSSAAATNSSAR